MPIEAMVDLTGGLAERYELKDTRLIQDTVMEPHIVNKFQHILKFFNGFFNVKYIKKNPRP